MMPLQGDRSAIIQTMLPDDPEPGHEFVLPEGQTIGGANVINIWKGGKLLGAITQVSPIPNVSGKYDAVRVTSRLKLRVGDLVRIRGWQHNFTAIKFVEGHGWIGCQTTGKPSPLMDKHMKILEVFPIGDSTPGFYLYERVCLEIIKGDEDEKSTNPSPAPSGNRTTPSSGPADAPGSSSSPRRSSPTPRRRTNRGGKPRGRNAGSSTAPGDEQ